MLLPVGLMAGAVTPLLLDGLAATVVGCYGLRKLRAAYDGPCLQVRRFSDGMVQDIGFAFGVLDTAELLAFCGTDDGFVSAWYDQSMSAQHAVQGAGGAQPVIVTGGVVAALDPTTTRPAVPFDATSKQWLGNDTFALGGTATAALIVARHGTNSNSYPRLLSFAAPGFQDYQSTASLIWAYCTNNDLHGYQGGNAAQVALGADAFQVASVFDGAANVLTLDGVQAPPANASGALADTGQFGIGYGGNEAWDGAIAEVVVVAGSLLAEDQAAIRSSQQGFYGTP